jgi:hypothetical protein
VVDVRRATHLQKDKGKVDEYTAMVAVGNMKVHCFITCCCLHCCHSKQGVAVVTTTL